uniref:Uncharacterized protein n=1 Tax=Romanomermis culicivorax TaxID=13658 RepID=A0A915K5H8_ROMCU
MILADYSHKDSSNAHTKIQNPDVELQKNDKSVPPTGQILPLIHQQEQIIEELVAQLKLHKRHAQRLKDSNASREKQIDIVLEELKAQFVKNNLSEFLQSSDQISRNPPPPDISIFKRHICDNCEKLKNDLDQVSKALSELEERHKLVLSDLAHVKCNEKECIEKVIESSKLVDQAIAEKTEVNIQLNIAQNRSAQLSMEIKNLISTHQKDLEQCAQNAQLSYKTELESMRNQIKSYSSSEKNLIQTNQTLKQENERLITEIATLNSKVEILEHNSKLKITTIESNLKDFSKGKEQLEKEVVELKKRHAVDLEEKLEIKSDLDHASSHFGSEIKNLQSQLKSKTKEVLEQKYFVENLQNELNKYKLQNFRLVDEMDAISINATNEMKERIRLMELTHGNSFRFDY